MKKLIIPIFILCLLIIFKISKDKISSNSLTTIEGHEKLTASYIKIQGFTQGTTYHIIYQSQDSTDYQQNIKILLRNFDLSLSTYIETSIISRINNNETNVETDTFFVDVFNKAVEIHSLTNGAFDITVGPLVKSWGFGKVNKAQKNPNIDSLLQFVGMGKVKLENEKIIKSDPRINLDVNAIAQGYSVDVVSKFLENKGIKNYMVEIGGEVRAMGLNPKGKVWRIGVDRPTENNNVYDRKLFAAIELSNRSLATSGNYRKFHEENGEKFVHTINPKTGKTVRSNLLSVTVLSDDCMTADALATAFMVVGVEKGKTLLKTLPNIDVYFIFINEDGEFSEFFTSGFEPILQKL